MKAIVVLKKGEVMKEEEVIEYCRVHLASYKKPKSIEFVEALPRNPSGKVLKTDLRKLPPSPTPFEGEGKVAGKREEP